MTFLKLILALLKLPFTLLTLAIEACFWTLYFFKQIFYKILDIATASKAVKNKMLHCPHGHEVATEGGVYECEACGFVYEGSIWFCANPECPDPVTSHIECPTCGLSLRNPYRWGRP